MNERTLGYLQGMWLAGFLVAAAFLWSQGSTLVAIGLGVVGLAFEIVGFATSFVRAFREAGGETEEG